MLTRLRADLMFLVLGGLLLACQPIADLRHGTTMTTAPTQKRFLALGDSYTIGEGVAEAERWPVQLAAQLRTHGLALADPQIIARTGWTTDELHTGIQQAHPQGPFDLVTLLIGVNNQYRGLSPQAYRQEFANLLDQAIAFAGGQPARVIVLSIPDWGVTPFAAGRDRAAIGATIDEFNTINRDVTLRAGAHYVDITGLSRKAADELTLLADDQLHPSGRQYAAWVAAVLPVAIQALAIE
jgi:lysophospholipase L1-like esterase